MIIHGRKDLNVSVEHAYRLEKRLNELNKRVEAWYFDEYTHYFPPAVNRKIVSDLTTWMKTQEYVVNIRMNSKCNASTIRRGLRMGMPLELNTMIVTKGNEKRIGENDFILEKKDYRLYPLEIPIEVKKTIDSETTAMALIKKLEWENNKTTITYQLISLNSTN